MTSRPMRKPAACWAAPICAQRWPAISCPTTVIVGEEDYAAPLAMAQAMHDGIRNSRLVVLEKARHLTPLEVPDRIASELTMLLKGGVPA